MSENELPTPRRSGIQVFLGFLLGMAASLATLIASIFFGVTMQWRQPWLFPALNAAVLIALGIAALRHARESSYAMGMVIALSIALLLDGACAVMLLK